MRCKFPQLVVTGLLTAAIGSAHNGAGNSAKLRTVITTDMESDDLASLIRYLLYSNEFDTQGLIYTTSRFHWAGDGNGTKFFLPGREYDTPQTEWRWVGTRYIQDIVLPAYAKVHPNLLQHDPSYPTPDDLLSTVKVGNIIFEGEMDQDTEGSELIESLLLDKDPRLLYLQAWGGTNTIARALKSIEQKNSDSSNWPKLKKTISRKAIILASGFQDETYVNYIAPRWPEIQIHNLAGGYNPWSYHCAGGGPYGLPEDQKYFAGTWTKANIQKGPLGSLYRSWLDGQSMPGDPLDVFGDPELAADPDLWCKPLNQYDFLSEGDNVCFNPLIDTGLDDPTNPTVGGWGGRLLPNTTYPNLWALPETEKHRNGTEIEDYSTTRWIAPAQNDFAARMQWTLTGNYSEGNHPPSVKIVGSKKVKGRPNTSVTLRAATQDPDGDVVATSWWQYLEEGTYPNFVKIQRVNEKQAKVVIPADAKVGQTISIILQGTDDGEHPLTRYDRVKIEVI
ncbi:hypothetical protein HJFPF1_07576 [Paramyrothecium foliicola]|nr:hypothetical protein HJFPF1_07576 [Paramyrothecium foliicola]